MSWRSPIRGYAHVWDRVSFGSWPGGGAVRSITARGAIILDGSPIPVLYGHDHARRKSTGPVDLWCDDFGLAFEFIPVGTPAGYSLVSGIVRQAYCECSCLLVPTRIEGLGDGCTTKIVEAHIHEVSILPSGGCPGAACWSSASPLHELSSAAQAALPHWLKGQAKRQTWNCRQGLVDAA